MGNNLLQISNALLLARSLGLKFIQLPHTELVRIAEPTTVGDITFLPPDHDIRRFGAFVVSTFYHGPCFERLGVQMSERRAILKKYLLDAIDVSLPEPEPEGCLTIHLRSGDAFHAQPHPDFAQPPLIFYKTIIEDARDRLGIDRVRLVYEDKRNPCVDALQAHLEKERMQLLHQSGTLQQDLEQLLTARHLVFGYGTFGVGVCLISNSAQTVRVFGASGPAYKQFAHFSEVQTWGDIGDRYPRIGEWSASKEQLDLMLNLPLKEIGQVDFFPTNPDRKPDWWTQPERDL